MGKTKNLIFYSLMENTLNEWGRIHRFLQKSWKYLNRFSQTYTKFYPWTLYYSEEQVIHCWLGKYLVKGLASHPCIHRDRADFLYFELEAPNGTNLIISKNANKMHLDFFCHSCTECSLYWQRAKQEWSTCTCVGAIWPTGCHYM